MRHQGLIGAGGSVHPTGKSSLTFDHILGHLQGELQQSHKTSAGLLPYPQNLPPAMSPAPKPPSSSVPPAVIGELQLQLQETQSSTTKYTVIFFLLNSLVAEHSSLQQDIGLIKEFMEECEWDSQTREKHHSDKFSNDDDNPHTVSTIIPHEPER